MKKLFELIRAHQQKLLLGVAFLVVAGISFSLGHHTLPSNSVSKTEPSETPAAMDNYTPIVSGTQTPNPEPPANVNQTCAGQIKGSSSMIYHLPGGAFYDKTTKPIECFDTEAQAQAAGFRKSSR